MNLGDFEKVYEKVGRIINCINDGTRSILLEIYILQIHICPNVPSLCSIVEFERESLYDLAAARNFELSFITS